MTTIVTFWFFFSQNYIKNLSLFRSVKCLKDPWRFTRPHFVNHSITVWTLFCSLCRLTEQVNTLPPTCQGLWSLQQPPGPRLRPPHRPWGSPAACPHCGERPPWHPGGRSPKSHKLRRTGSQLSSSAPAQTHKTRHRSSVIWERSG